MDILSVPNSKKPPYLIVSLIMAAVIMGVISGYSCFFRSNASPESFVQKMTENMVDVNSLEFTGQIEGEMDTLDFPLPSLFGNGGLLPSNEILSTELAGEFSLDFSGSLDLDDSDHPKAMIRVDLDTHIFPDNIGLEVRVIENNFYVNLASIPDLGFIALSLLKDQWVMLDSATALDEVGLDGIMPEVNPEINAQHVDQIKKAVSGIVLIKITNVLPDEAINGLNAYHYEFELDKSGIIELFLEITKIVGAESLPEIDLQDLMEMLDAMENSTGEIWIGKRDYLPYKILFTLDVKENEEAKSKGAIIVKVQLSHYDEPVSIDIPALAKTLEDIIGDPFSGIFGGDLQNLGEGFQMPVQ